MNGLSSTNSVSSFGDVSVDVDLQSTFTRSYPSIKDYYNANSTSPEKPIQLQPGLSNYSSLIFGDDRIGFNESVMNVTYKGAVEDRMKIPSPSKAKSIQARRKDYDEALERVGNLEIDRLERMMKDKLVQRSAKTSSHFQINKAFKFFDREQCGRIHIEGFTRALEFLGFQFSDNQNLALFARYDVDCSGDIDYPHFIQTAMFEPEVHHRAHNPHSPSSRPSTQPGHLDTVPAFSGIGDSDDLDVAQLKQMQEVELHRIFSKIDKIGSGAITNTDDFELLLLALGKRVSPSSAASLYTDLQESGQVTFHRFLEWWDSNSHRSTTGSVHK